jgi:hypothetical protein
VAKTKKNAALEVCLECKCRGYEVLATFAGGTILSWSSCKIEPDGTSSPYVSPLGREGASSAKMRRDELHRCDIWAGRIAAISSCLLES